MSRVRSHSESEPDGISRPYIRSDEHFRKDRNPWSRELDCTHGCGATIYRGTPDHERRATIEHLKEEHPEYYYAPEELPLEHLQGQTRSPTPTHETPNAPLDNNDFGGHTPFSIEEHFWPHNTDTPPYGFWECKRKLADGTWCPVEVPYTDADGHAIPKRELANAKKHVQTHHPERLEMSLEKAKYHPRARNHRVMVLRFV